MRLIQGALPVEEAFALSTEVAWNQTFDDWNRLISLAGDGCFGIVDEARLVTTASAFVYDARLAWIGMVITSPQHRGKGYARILLERCLAFCDERGVSCVKLDATDLGRPVYQKLGFVDERPVSRWMRPAGALAIAPDGINTDYDEALDLAGFGADRAPLLRAFAKQETYAIHARGHSFARNGRTAHHFGPCVARDAPTFETLLHAFLSRHGDEASQLDLCDENRDAVRIVEAAGYRKTRQLMRMYRGDPSGASIASGPMVYALGAFEYG